MVGCGESHSTKRFDNLKQKKTKQKYKSKMLQKKNFKL